MQRSGTRLLPMIITIIVIIVVIVAIVSIGRAIFFGGDETTPIEVDNGQTELLNTSANHGVQLTVRGPIVAEEDFKSYQMEVTPSSREIVVYQGYLDDEQKSKRLGNNRAAYEQFVYALDKANMMKGSMPADDGENDLRGICATGYIYEYAVLVDDEPAKHLWTSTCDGSKGTLQASTAQLNNLFLKQIPDSEELVPFSPASLHF